MSALEYFEERVKYTYSPMDLMAERKSNTNLCIVDVRNGPVEMRKNKVIGAIVIPLSELGEKLDTLPRDKKIVLYCWDIWCNTASKAAVMLLKHGYSDVIELRGGITAWNEMKFPVEPIC